MIEITEYCGVPLLILSLRYINANLTRRPQLQFLWVEPTAEGAGWAGKCWLRSLNGFRGSALRALPGCLTPPAMRHWH